MSERARYRASWGRNGEKRGHMKEASEKESEGGEEAVVKERKQEAKSRLASHVRPPRWVGGDQFRSRRGEV